jgi:Bacterial membrane protein YfhO
LRTTRGQRPQGPRIAALRTPAVLLGLLLVALLVQWPALTSGLIPMEDDIRVFYFPILVATKEALERFALPLWTPGVFGGYPLFADGEAGALYPPHLLILPWLTVEASIVALWLLHGWLASVFTYGLIRTLGGGRLGGLVAGISYAYSGFAAGQIIHLNIYQALVWLPLELLLVERALQAASPGQRYRYAVLAGGVFGIQALAAHIHVTLMSALTITAFLGYRGVFGNGSVLRGLGRATLLLVIVGGIGASLSAVQLLPLRELGSQTYRGDGVDTPLAAINSIWPGDLLTLLLPRLHDTVQGGFWGPWVRWDTTLYVGVLPLALATLALCVRSCPHRLFFGGFGLIALAMTLGPNAPVPLWSSLHTLPGFEVLRSPGRYALLFSLCVAVLAGCGADWLWRQAGPARIRGLAVLLLGGAGAIALAFSLDGASVGLRTPTPDALRLAGDYVGLPGVPTSVDGTPVTAERVAALAADALSPSNPATAWQLALVGTAVLLVGLWLLTGGLRGRAVAVRAALAAATVGAVAADLWMVSVTAHPYGNLADLRPRVPDVLMANHGEPFRVYTEPASDEKNLQVEPNRLLAAGIQEANGYSSLQPDRHVAYLAAVQYSDNQLLDLWNVRYVVRRNRPELLPSHGGISFHPERPLFSGARSISDEGGVLLPDGGPARTGEVRVVAALVGAERVPDGMQVARVLLRGSDDSIRDLPLLAGRHVADGRLNVPGASSAVQHSSPDVAFQYPRENPTSSRFGEQLYYGRLAVDPPLEVRFVGVEPSATDLSLEIYGIGLVDPATGEVTQARTNLKYRPIYRDDQLRIFENTTAMPRAFLAGQAIVARDEHEALRELRFGPHDPRMTAILEGPLPSGFVVPQPTRRPVIGGAATITSYENKNVTIRTSALEDSILVLTDPYFPGWVARVDGTAAPIVRADYLFRGLAIPAGSHTVVFSYEPGSVALGAAITLLGALVVIIVIGVRLVEVLREQAARRVPGAHRVREPVYASIDAVGGSEV